MTSRDRIMTALSGGIPDRVPYMEFGIDRSLASRILGWPVPASVKTDLESNHFTPSELTELADKLGMDNFPFVMRAPVYAEKHPGKDGRLYYGNGLLKTMKDVEDMELPDPSNDALYNLARQAIEAKGDRAACFVTRAGMFPALLGMGIEGFCLALYDDRGLVETLLDKYFAWSITVADKISSLGFDFYVTTDDMAFKSGPYFSREVFDEFMLPRYLELAEHVSIPWVMHTDGNILPYMESLLEIGIAGIHPLEKGAVDTADFKARYGKRVCMCGNVDLNLLSEGTPEMVREEVRWLIRTAGPEGGYILTSGNSLASYCKPENVLAMTDEVKISGSYPLTA